STRVWVASASGRAKTVTAAFLDGRSDAASTSTIAGGGRFLDLPAHGAGLLSIDADESAVSAWLDDGDGDLAEVPVIGARDFYPAGATPWLDLAGVASWQLGAANLGDAAMSCRATLFDAT